MYMYMYMYIPHLLSHIPPQPGLEELVERMGVLAIDLDLVEQVKLCPISCSKCFDVF